MKGFVVTVLAIAVLVCGGWALGWLEFSETESTSGVQVDKTEVEKDTKKAAEATKHTAQKVVEETKEAAQNLTEGTKEAIEKVKNSGEEVKEETEKALDKSEKKLDDQAEDAVER